MLAQSISFKLHVPCSLWQLNGATPTATFAPTPLSYNFAVNSRRLQVRIERMLKCTNAGSVFIPLN